MVWCYIGDTAGGNLKRIKDLASSTDCIRGCEGQVRGAIVAYSCEVL